MEYDDLVAVIDAPAEARPAMLKTYVENWYKQHMKDMSWHGNHKQARQDFSRKLKWDPSDFSSEKLPGGYCLRRPQPSCFFRWSPNKGCPASFSQ